MRQHFDINADTLEFCSATGSRIAQGASGLVLRYGESQELEITVWKGGQKQVIAPETGVVWELAADLDRRFTDEPMVGPVSAAVENGDLVFAFDCDSEKFLAVANGRPTSFLIHVQIARRAEGTDYYLMALAQAAGCVYDGNAEASRAVPHYYSKPEVDARLEAKQDALTAGDNVSIVNNTISARVPEGTASLRGVSVGGTTMTVSDRVARIPLGFYLTIVNDVLDIDTAQMEGFIYSIVASMDLPDIYTVSEMISTATAVLTSTTTVVGMISTATADCVTVVNDALPSASTAGRDAYWFFGTSSTASTAGRLYRHRAASQYVTVSNVDADIEAQYHLEGDYILDSTTGEYVKGDCKLWWDGIASWFLSTPDAGQWLNVQSTENDPSGTYEQFSPIINSLTVSTVTVTPAGYEDITPYATTADLAAKQDALTAGDNIVIEGGTISASLAGGTNSYMESAVYIAYEHSDLLRGNYKTGALYKGEGFTISYGGTVSGYYNGTYTVPTASTGSITISKDRLYRKNHNVVLDRPPFVQVGDVRADVEAYYHLAGLYGYNRERDLYECAANPAFTLAPDGTSWVLRSDESPVWRWNRASEMYPEQPALVGVYTVDGADETAYGTIMVTEIGDPSDRLKPLRDETPYVPADEAITSIIANGNTASVSGGAATVTVPISGGTVTNNSITITDGGTNTTFLGMGTASVTGQVVFGGGTSHGILDIGNSAGTIVPNQLTHISASGLIWGGWSCSVNSFAYGALAIGFQAQALGGRGSVAFGNAVRADFDSQLVTGRNNIPANTARTVANGSNSSNKLNIEELSWNGDHCIAGGHQQKVTEIPAATSAYTLAEGAFEHTPSTAPTYTLPDPLPIINADSKLFLRASDYDGTGYYGWIYGTTKRYTASATPAVGDNTYTNTALTSGATPVTAIDNRTHEVILRVTFSNVQTLAFQDAQGNTIVPRPSLAIASTSVVVYLCRWFGNAGGWTIYAVSEVD